MPDAKPQLSLALATPTALGPAGLVFQLQLPVARKLQQANLQIGADSAQAAELSGLVLDSDASDGKGGLNGSSDAHWLSVDWGVEKALVSLTITAPADVASPQSGVRVRMFSAGNWLPLPPRDSFAFSSKLAQSRFPAVAASRLMVEMLSENKVADKYTGVLVPGAAKISAVTVSATPQPCHVSLAVGDEAPFFTRPGPLPLAPVAVDGFTRAVNRYLTDHPGALTVPLVFKAAADAKLKVTAFDAVQEAAPVTPGGQSGQSGQAGQGTGSKPAPRPETPGVQPAAQPSAVRGRWSDTRHSLAQSFAALAEGKLLSALELYGRALGSEPVSATLSLFADDHGRPADQARVGPLALDPSLVKSEAGWLRFELPQPVAWADGPWWAVLQTSGGELLWYLGEQVPPGAGAGLYRVASGAWMPADPAATPWLQARLQLLGSA